MPLHNPQPASADVHVPWRFDLLVGRLRHALLRVPLMAKLLGANLLVALTASAAFSHWQGQDLVVLGGLTLAASLGLSTLLVRIALGPLDELETLARHVALGATRPRADTATVADDRFVELRSSFERLLAQVEDDRSRIRQLARLSLEVREAERASLADTLRDATAQEMAALSMRLAAASAASTDPRVRAELDAAREIAARITTEVGHMADAAAPGLLRELGLPAALEAMARRVAERSGMSVTVETADWSRPLPVSLAKVLFRVAEEAVRNTEVHAHAQVLRLTLQAVGDSVQLRIEDDGTGFDAAVAEHGSIGIGLFRARELLVHCGGTLHLATAPGLGTTIVAEAPVLEMPTDEL